VGENEQAEIVVETSPNQGGSGIRGDLNYRVIIMRQIDRCGITLSKLPHEFMNENLNEPLGCTYQDIRNSFYDGVRLLESLVAPYADKDFLAKKKEIEDRYKTGKDQAALYFDRYSNVIILCARLGMLLEQMGDEGI